MGNHLPCFIIVGSLILFFLKMRTHPPIAKDFCLQAATDLCKLTISVDSIPSLGCLPLAVEQVLGPLCSPAPGSVI